MPIATQTTLRTRAPELCSQATWSVPGGTFVAGCSTESAAGECVQQAIE